MVSPQEVLSSCFLCSSQGHPCFDAQFQKCNATPKSLRGTTRHIQYRRHSSLLQNSHFTLQHPPLCLSTVFTPSYLHDECNPVWQPTSHSAMNTDFSNQTLHYNTKITTLTKIKSNVLFFVRD